VDDRNEPPIIAFFSVACRVEVKIIYYQRQKDSPSPGSVDFSDVQIVHKFIGRATPNLDFKVTILFNVKYLENGTR